MTCSAPWTFTTLFHQDRKESREQIGTFWILLHLRQPMGKPIHGKDYAGNIVCYENQQKISTKIRFEDCDRSSLSAGARHILMISCRIAVHGTNEDLRPPTYKARDHPATNVVIQQHIQTIHHMFYDGKSQEYDMNDMLRQQASADAGSDPQNGLVTAGSAPRHMTPLSTAPRAVQPGTATRASCFRWVCSGCSSARGGIWRALPRKEHFVPSQGHR